MPEWFSWVTPQRILAALHEIGMRRAQPRHGAMFDGDGYAETLGRGGGGIGQDRALVLRISLTLKRLAC